MNRSQNTRMDNPYLSPASALEVPDSTIPTRGKMTLLTLSLAAAWSLTLLIMSVLWGAGAVAPPFGDAAPGNFSSVLDHLSVPAGAGVIGTCSLISFIAAALLLTLPRLRGRAAGPVGVFTAALALVTTVIFTDTMVLAYLGYMLGLQFPPIPRGVALQMILLVGPGLWAAVWACADADARTVRRGSVGAGVEATVGSRVRSSLSAKIAVAVAVIVPGFYALTRILWAMGVSVGLSDEIYAEGQAIGLWYTGLGLAGAALVGVLLTLGLVQKWGERLPRWAGPLANRRVPILLATIPATFVSLAVFTAGAGVLRNALFEEVDYDGSWAASGPLFFFALWGLALGWATYQYRARRLRSEEGAVHSAR